MRHFSPHRLRPLKGMGVAAGTSRPAMRAGLPDAAEAFRLTRTNMARARPAAPSSIFERARRSLQGISTEHRFGGAPEAAERAWSDIDDHAHVDRRAPPGRDQGGGGQGQPDRG